MKKSQLQSIIHEEVKAALNEASNPELDKLVKNFVKGLANKYQYGEHDALYAIFESLKRQQMLGKDVNFRPY
jgi:hypothetical protein